MPVETLFITFACFLLIGAFYGWHRYGTVLNPLTYTSVISIGIFSLLSGEVCLILLNFKPYTAADVSKTLLITFVNYIGLTIPYLSKRPYFLKYYGCLIKLLGLDSIQIPNKHFKPVKFIGLIICMFASFIALAIIGGGGIQWITNTREAYITNRVGVGPFYLGMQWFLMSAYLYYLWACNPRGIRLLIVMLIFSALSYFSGSKASILTTIVISAIYYNFYVRPILIKEFGALFCILLFSFSLLLSIQGFNDGLLMYFGDYFNTTAIFISRFDEFGFRYGSATISDLWFYVPRGLWHDKPYEYGALVIHQVLFPNMAEIGNTPGFLNWTMSYLDFGIIGVFMNGILLSIWQRSAYEYYLKHKENFFAFIFMMQFALYPSLAGATVPITFILTLCLSFYLRLVLKSSKKRRYVYS